MKKILLLVVSILLATVVSAQQQLATLNHNDSITVYYGATALVQAHNDAVNGDVITLSSGTFDYVNVTKAITIRGNGMERDTIAGTEPTFINGMQLYILNNGTSSFIAEGICFSGYVNLYEVHNPRFSKCKIGSMSYDSYGAYGWWYSMENGVFIDCIISSINLFHSTGTQFFNSVVNGCPSSAPNTSFRNCIVKYNRSHASSTEMSFYNCIMYDNVGYGYGLTSNVTSFYNCIGVYYGNDNGFNPGMYFLNTNDSYNNRNYGSLNSVFKYFNGTYSDGMSFELQDSIATNYLGTDGTQVGVYGGMVPFNPRVNTPRYVNCSVAPHTTLDGKLSVDIEVVSE